MEIIKSPQIQIEKEGESLKVLNVTGEEGMHMPLHHSTREAVVICQKGAAVLNMEGKSHEVSVGNTIIIPAGVEHSLTAHNDFQALVIMDIKSAIIFENN
jgi:quercetin dioxygenase-like cupin family protein